LLERKVEVIPQLQVGKESRYLKSGGLTSVLCHGEGLAYSEGGEGQLKPLALNIACRFGEGC